MRSRPELGDALLATLHDPAPAGLRPQLEWFLPDHLPQLALHAARHRVVAFVPRALRQARLPTPENMVTPLARAHAHWTAVHLTALEDLRTATSLLSSAGVGHLVVKGPVLAEHYYPSADLRMYDDLDLVIAPGDFQKAIDAMESAGLELVDRNWALIRSEGRAQLHLRLPLGTLADVHWSLLNRGSVREAFDLDPHVLFARARSLTVAGIEIQTLDEVDTLLHLCVHATLSGGDRLVWSKDIERAIRVDAPLWDEVVRRAREWRAGPSVAIALDRASRMLDAPVPREVLMSLYASRARRQITALVDRRRPPEQSVGETSVSVMWSQVSRDRWRHTVAALRGRASRGSRNLLQPGDGGAPIFREVGEPGDERAYLHEVTAGEEPDAGSAPS